MSNLTTYHIGVAPLATCQLCEQTEGGQLKYTNIYEFGEIIDINQHQSPVIWVVLISY